MTYNNAMLMAQLTEVKNHLQVALRLLADAAEMNRDPGKQAQTLSTLKQGARYLHNQILNALQELRDEEAPAPKPQNPTEAQ